MGIELGPYGTFTLRLVHPWRIEGELVGYIELGEEIEHITPRLAEALGVQLLIILNKDILNREDWEEGQTMMGRSGDWELYPYDVLIDQTLSQIPDEIGSMLDTDHHHRVHDEAVTTLALDDREYRVGMIPLIDRCWSRCRGYHCLI